MFNQQERRKKGLLRSVFGSPKHEIWEELAKEIGGQYVDQFLGGDCLVVRFGEWKVKLDSFYSGNQYGGSYFTRMRAQFLSKDKFHFKIYRKSFYSSIWKFFGMHDIKIGEQKFDDNFIVKGNKQQKLKLLLQDTRLKHLIDAQPDIYFKIHKSLNDYLFNEDLLSEKPDDIYELYFRCVGEIDNKYQLKSLFELFSLTLERLVEIGSAYDNAPDDWDEHYK